MSKKGLKIMISVSSNEKITFKICSDIIRGTTNDSNDGGVAIRQKTSYFRIYFERFGQNKKKRNSFPQVKLNNNI